MKSLLHWMRAMLMATAAGGVCSSNALADAEAHWRLFVGDHTEPVVRAIEMEDGSEAGLFRFESNATLHRTQSGRTVFAIQGEAGKVSAIGSGIAIGDHGDHADLDVEEPIVLSTVLTGEKPAHFFENGGQIALFFDGEGRVDIFPEQQVLDENVAPRKVDVGAPHHGLASPVGRFVIHSVPNPEDAASRPVALRVLDAEDAQIGEDIGCPGLHGQAASGRVLAFGCHDGVVIATTGGTAAPQLRHVPTLHLGEGNVSTLRGGTALQFFLGNFGQNAVVLIEPGAQPNLRKIELPTRRVDFAIDPANTRNAYILTEDGYLHLLDVVSGRLEKSLRLTEPYSMDGHWRDPRPRLAVAGNHVAVTDPLRGLIRLVDVGSFTEERTIAVTGTPYTIVAIGGSGRQHD